MEENGSRPQVDSNLLLSAKKLLEEKAALLSSMSEQELNTFVSVLNATQSKEFLELEYNTKEFCEKFYKMYNLSTVGFVTLNKDGHIVAINNTLANWLGVKNKDAQNRPFSEFILDCDRHLCDLNSILSGSKELSLRLVKKDSALLNASIEAQILVNGKDGPRFLLALADKTETTRFEKMYKLRESQLHTAIDNLPFVFFALDKSERYILQNSICREGVGDLLGKKPEEVPGVDESTLKIWQSNNKRALAGEIIKEEVVYKINGENRYVYNIISPIVYENEIVGILGCNLDITDQKKITEKLKESEEKFRNLAENCPSMIFIKDKNRIRYVNNKCIDLLGYTEEEYLSESFDFLDLIAPESRGLAISNFKKHFQAQEVGIQEYNLLTKQGKIINTLITTKLISYDNSPAILGVITDVTEHNLLEQAFVNFKESFMYFAEQLPMGAFITTIAGEFYYVNETLSHMLEYSSPEELKGLNVEKVYKNPSDRASLIEKLKESGKLSNYEIEVVTKNKKIKNIIINIIIHENQMWGLFIDITERKKQEEILEIDREILKKIVGQRTEALNQATEEIETIFSTSHFSVICLDKDFSFVRVNKTYAEQHAKDPDFFIGKNYFKLYADREQEAIFRQVLETGNSYDMYSRPYVLKSGLAGYSNWSLHPVKNEQGVVEGLIVFIVDVTEFKRMEQELEKAKEELGNTRRLSDIGMLAAIVAHELRNPLAAIKLAVYNLKHKENDSAVSRHIDNIDKKIDESDHIINNLLFYSRLRNPQYKKIDICRVLDECIEDMKSISKKSHLCIDKKITCLQGLIIDADPIQIKEMFSNILHNACDALELNEKCVIEVIAERDNDFIRISFKDSGKGIEEGDLLKIFEPFFTTKAKGTGLGLSVSLQIAQIHHGNIEVKSKKHEGTTVTVLLPIRRQNGKKSFDS